MSAKSHPLPLGDARRLWLDAQRLLRPADFGSGAAAVTRAIEHLGYVQIDTINVIERSHHHILFTRLPNYRPADLAHAQSADKSVFEYWTHALAYVPTAHYRYFIDAMRRYREHPPSWFGTVTPADYRRLLRRIRDEGALSIRDIDDDVLVDKIHPWASRKPSKRALQLGFYTGDLTIGARTGMVKSYELSDRHFGWPPRPRRATEAQYAEYLLARGLRSQGVVSLDSVCYGEARSKPAVRKLIDAGVRRRLLVPIHLDAVPGSAFWTTPEALDTLSHLPEPQDTHILSPFDPLIIQRKRLAGFFGYDHRFEAYVPAARRVMGYFALPVLVGDRIVAAIDLKTDRPARRLLVQKWTWLQPETASLRVAIEEAMQRFEAFQLADAEAPTRPVETDEYGRHSSVADNG